MNAPRQSRLDEAIEGLSWWLRDNWKVGLLLLGFAAAFVALGLWVTRLRNHPAIDEEAEVVRFGAYGTDEGPRPVVLVRMKDGRLLQLGVHRARTHVCRAGSRIHVVRRGPTVIVGRYGCRPRAP